MISEFRNHIVLYTCLDHNCTIISTSIALSWIIVQRIYFFNTGLKWQENGGQVKIYNPPPQQSLKVL